uniref:Uncharacterized protein n=1 Tax=Tetranychus urticae TaxID=32264 RepID=T1JWY3_TETUR
MDAFIGTVLRNANATLKGTISRQWQRPIIRESFGPMVLTAFSLDPDQKLEQKINGTISPKLIFCLGTKVMTDTAWLIVI